VIGCVLAAPAAAQTQSDTVRFAQVLSEELTAIDARRPAARAAVGEWSLRVARCGKPRLRSRAMRVLFAQARAIAAHTVALQELAPDLERFAARLRALPVTDRAVRGGIRELLVDYENTKRLISHGPEDICRLVRASRRGGRLPPPPPYDTEDGRASVRAVDLRESRLGAAQRELLRIEADPQLARALDAMFTHITAGLRGRTVSGRRERLVPPFPVVVDPAELTRLRDETAALTRTTEVLAQAQKTVGRRLTRVFRRIPPCEPVIREGFERRRRAKFQLYVTWALTQVEAATAEPIAQFRQALAAVAVTDRTLAEILESVTAALPRSSDLPIPKICQVLRTWRRQGWSRRHTPPVARELELRSGVGESWSGIRLEDETIHRAVLARRGVPRHAINALMQPDDFLLATARFRD
jgi:hypothetical protein